MSLAAAETVDRDAGAADSDPLGAGRDPEFIERHRGLVEAYASYFNPEVRGFEKVPERGPLLLVGNHSGGATPPDMPILLTAWWRERGVDEPVYGLFHSFFLGLPGIGDSVRKAGALEAGPAAAEAALRAGASVLVYPGGDHEAYRPWTERHRIEFAGRTGFVRLALRTGVPIVPVVSCGAQNSLIVLSRGERLARFMPHLRAWRLKVCPILLGPPWGISVGLPTIPLPARVTVELGQPLDLAARFGREAADDDAVVAACYDEITSTMQHTLEGLAAERRDA